MFIEWESDKVSVNGDGGIHHEMRTFIRPMYGRPNVWYALLLFLVGAVTGGSFGWFVRPDASTEMIQREIAVAVEMERARADREIGVVKREAMEEIRVVTDRVFVAMSETLAILGKYK